MTLEVQAPASNLEFGKSNPSLKAVLAVCAAVGLEFDLRPSGQTLEPPDRELAAPVSLADVFARARS